MPSSLVAVAFTILVVVVMAVVEEEKNSWGGFEDGGDGMGLWELSIFDTFRFQR